MWKKIILCFGLLFLICGCQKDKKGIETVVVEEENVVITINYPMTGELKLDQNIVNYVNTVYKNFQKDYANFYSLTEKSELNIDYKSKLINDRYWNIILYTFVNTSSLAHPANDIKTFVYDKKEKKILTLSDVLSEKQVEKLVPVLEKKLLQDYQQCLFLDQLHNVLNDSFDRKALFTFDDQNLTIYFPRYEIAAGYCNIIQESIPFSMIDLKISIQKENEISVSYVPPQEKTIDPNRPVVALTFDDGPSRYTDQILELLKENNSSATFFILGNKVESYQDTIGKMISYGSEVGNHTYNHKWLNKLSIDDLKEQVNQTQDIIQTKFNYVPRLFRPSYGSKDQKIKQNINLEFVYWTLDSNDWRLKNSKKIVNRVLKTVKDGDIIIFHDLYKTTYESLKTIVPTLKEQGYQLITVSELDEIKLLRGKKN